MFKRISGVAVIKYYLNYDYSTLCFIEVYFTKYHWLTMSYSKMEAFSNK